MTQGELPSDDKRALWMATMSATKKVSHGGNGLRIAYEAELELSGMGVGFLRRFITV